MAEQQLVDEDGENQALRDFLMQYSCDRPMTIGAMLAHMNRAGWRGLAPAFALDARPERHLTKSGAQTWIRHLINLENTVRQEGAERATIQTINSSRAARTFEYVNRRVREEMRRTETQTPAHLHETSDGRATFEALMRADGWGEEHFEMKEGFEGLGYTSIPMAAAWRCFRAMQRSYPR